MFFRTSHHPEKKVLFSVNLPALLLAYFLILVFIQMAVYNYGGKIQRMWLTKGRKKPVDKR